MLKNALGDGGLVDLVDRGLQCLVELLVALLGGQVLGKRAAEGSDQSVILGELFTELVPAVPAGQGDDPHHLWVFNEVGVEIGLLRDGQLENDLLAIF